MGSGLRAAQVNSGRRLPLPRCPCHFTSQSQALYMTVHLTQSAFIPSGTLQGANEIIPKITSYILPSP